jgi:cell division protein FtsB
MAKTIRNGAELLAQSALTPEPPATSKKTINGVPEAAAVTPTLPRTYTAPVSPSPSVGEVVPMRNRKVVRRKVSTFNIILLLLGSAAAIVLYIGNIIAVDRLVAEIDALQRQHQKIVSEQEILRAEANRLSALERINKKASEELGLVNPNQPPTQLNADRQRIHDIEEALSQRRTAQQ